MHSDDYKKGWFDGYQAGKNQPFTPVQAPDTFKAAIKFKATCGKCNISWEGPMAIGRCPHSECPMQLKARSKEIL